MSKAGSVGQAASATNPLGPAKTGSLPARAAPAAELSGRDRAGLPAAGRHPARGLANSSRPTPVGRPRPDRGLTLSGLLDDLVAQGHLRPQSAAALRTESAAGRPPGLHPLQVIAAQNFEDRKRPGHNLDGEALTRWLSAQSGLPYLRIDPLQVDVTGVTRVMSYPYAQRHNILAIEVRPDRVLVATAEPYVDGWRGMLEQTLDGRKVVVGVANPGDIARYTVEFYTMARSVAKAAGDGDLGPPPGSFGQLLEVGGQRAPDADDAPIVSIVDWLLNYAFDQRASDIHMEPRRDQGHIRFRIDGVLHRVYELPVAVTSAVISRMKALGRMDVAEKRRPQDGRVKTLGPKGRAVELRLATLPTAYGEKLVVRIFDPEVLLRSFAELGLADRDGNRWQALTRARTGLLLVTGPTGSGKTTTLYSTLKQLATTEVNVCTVEDPIEMVEPSFNQTQVQPNLALRFADGVRALLRQDPDIIMIGEIRDRETAEMAIQAALTGHLVISTLHTNDAPAAITRLLDLGVPPYLIRAGVLGVMAQRLVRQLCPHCRQWQPADPASWAELVHPADAPCPASFAVGRGCLACRDTGYLGRVGIYELMPMSAALQRCLGVGRDVAEVRRQALREGLRPLRMAGAAKVAAGVTTVAEVLRVAPIGVADESHGSLGSQELQGTERSE